MLAAAFGGLGWLIGGMTTALLFAFCSLLAATGVYRYGDRALLGMLGARPFALAEDPVLRSGADKVAAKLGVRAPAALPDRRRLPAPLRGRPRARRARRSRSRSARCGRSAARSSKRRSRTSSPTSAGATSSSQTFVVLFAATLVETSRIGGWFSRFLLYVFAPIGAAFVHVLLSPKRELQADALAASATGAAHDLADALMRLDRAAELVDFAASPATEPLYPVDPFEPEGIARMFKTHPPLDARVRRLRELGAGSNGRVPDVSLEARRVAARTSRSRGCGRPDA